MMQQKDPSQHIYDLCKEHMHAYVLAETKDGNQFDGIITGLDEQNVYFAVPVQGNIDNNEPVRQFTGGYGSYGSYGGYGSGFGYGSGYGYQPPYYNYPPRRFERLIVPLAAIAALSVLPWY